MLKFLTKLEQAQTEKQLLFYGLAFGIAASLTSGAYTIYSNLGQNQKPQEGIEATGKPALSAEANMTDQAHCAVRGKSTIENTGDGVINVICGEIRDAHIGGE
jgi:hypothetical protein